MTESSHQDTRLAVRNVAIAGASGLVGQCILQGLLADDTVSEVHALCRRSLGIKHPKLAEHRVDFNNLPPLPRIDELYLALGTTIGNAGSQAAFRAVDFSANLAVAQAAMAAGARRIALVSAAGANAHSGIFYNRVKGELEDALEQLAPEALLIARPSLLLGDRKALGQTSRPFERFAAAIFGALGRAIPIAMRPVTAKLVAGALLARLPTARGKKIISSTEIHAQSANR